MSLEALMVASTTVAGVGLLTWWRFLDAHTTRPALTTEKILADAPEELRTAVFVLSDPVQTNIMFEALKLGTREHGFPFVAAWGYTDHGVDVEVQMLGGQKLTDWTNDDTCSTLATYFAVPEVTAVASEPSHVRLQLRTYDTLAAPIPAQAPVSVGVDLESGRSGSPKWGWRGGCGFCTPTF